MLCFASLARSVEDKLYWWVCGSRGSCIRDGSLSVLVSLFTFVPHSLFETEMAGGGFRVQLFGDKGILFTNLQVTFETGREDRHFRNKLLYVF